MKEKNILKLGMMFLLGIQLLWSSPSLATDYYIDANAGNDTYSGLAPNDAFASMMHAMRQLQAGDTLYIRSGEYLSEGLPLKSTHYNSGTSTQPITVKAYQNETPIIGQGTYFVIHDLKWWVFEGLTFQNSAYLLFGQHEIPGQCTATAEHITIRGNRFQHGSGNGVSLTCAINHTVGNCSTHNHRCQTQNR